jgi:hypothetical protein
MTSPVFSRGPNLELSEAARIRRKRRSGIQIASSGFACDGRPRGLLSSHRNIESSHVFNMDAAMQHTLQRQDI